jgi:hypothetical protein
MEIDSYDQAIHDYTAATSQEPSNEASSVTVAPEPTEEQSIQNDAATPTPEEGTPEASNWNPQDFAFKADGQVRTVKSKEEALSLMSLGFHYNLRAQKLNQREAALYSREEALKTNQSQPTAQKEPEEEFNPFAPPKDQNATALEQRLAQLEQLYKAQADKQNTADATQYATQVEDFVSSLNKDFSMSKEETDEFLWNAMQVADSFKDVDDLKAYFYKTHPEAPEKRAKILAEQDISKFKKSMSRNTVVNGTTVGNTPTTKTKIDSYESAFDAASHDPRISNAKGA